MELPWQNDFVPLMAAIGIGFLIVVTDVEPEHPKLFVMVTEYEFASFTVMH